MSINRRTVIKGALATGVAATDNPPATATM